MMRGRLLVDRKRPGWVSFDDRSFVTGRNPSHLLMNLAGRLSGLVSVAVVMTVCTTVTTVAAIVVTPGLACCADQTERRE